MPKTPRLVLVLAAGLLAGRATAAATTEHAMTPAPADPYAWLEDVGGDRPLAWVRAQNTRTDAELAEGPAFAPLQAQLQAILDSKAKIPEVEKIGDHYYNLWKDADHARGLWRRTTLEEYRKPEPRWETVLDLDALGKAEGENWVWHGAECLRPGYTRCLVALSRGGSDADVTREFDLATKSWVDGGFHRPESKGGMNWIDADRAYVYTDFGPDSMTTSGYPRTVREWKRGTPLAESTPVYAGQPGDLSVLAWRDHSPGFERDFVYRALAFYAAELYLRRADGTLAKVDAPDSAIKVVHDQWLTVQLRDAWRVGGADYPAGALLAIGFDAFMAGARDFTVLFAPTATTTLEKFEWTRNRLVLDVLDDVKNTLSVLDPADGWRAHNFAGAGGIGTLTVRAVDADQGDALWLTETGFLTPTTLSLWEPGARPEALKAMPAFFDASRHVVEQHFATSADGTRVPYFMVRPQALPFDGTAPTLLYGYGGFEVSLTPAYTGLVGKGWLEPGGVYVVANIRGGGEYGPRWHQAALKAARHKAYEDFGAVAQDLVARRVTSPAHLGIMGGSNGGLLVGNMLVRQPQLFGAAVVQVPLLDMKRYSHLLAGASWMAEYGDPDTDDWDFIRTFSPYQLFDPAASYPPTFLWTTTRDDRVHPAHARKMAARMLEAGKDVRYYENTEGGHGAGATNAQAAHMWALTYRFLWGTLAR